MKVEVSLNGQKHIAATCPPLTVTEAQQMTQASGASGKTTTTHRQVVLHALLGKSFGAHCELSRNRVARRSSGGREVKRLDGRIAPLSPSHLFRASDAEIGKMTSCQ